MKKSMLFLVALGAGALVAADAQQPKATIEAPRAS